MNVQGEHEIQINKKTLQDIISNDTDNDWQASTSRARINDVSAFVEPTVSAALLGTWTDLQKFLCSNISGSSADEEDKTRVKYIPSDEDSEVTYKLQMFERDQMKYVNPSPELEKYSTLVKK